MSCAPFSVDPAICRVWSGQSRRSVPTVESCADLIANIRAQGRQEIPAIVRPLGQDDTHAYEIICGARRHFAVAHLRADGCDLGFLIEPRDLSDEAAFRLADLENRNRRDITPYDRACAYADALEQHYGGVQKTMAEAMQISPAWLTRHLQLARLPPDLVACFADPGDLREHHARRIARMIDVPGHVPLLQKAAAQIGADRADGERVSAAEVLRRLEAALPNGAGRTTPEPRLFRRSVHDHGITLKQRGGTTTLQFPSNLTYGALRGAFDSYLRSAFPERRNP